jgi:hypothetical protein
VSATRKKNAEPESKVYSPPWREILGEMKSPSTSLYRIYQRAGIEKSQRYWLSRAPDLRLSVAYRMALAAGIDPGKFMVAVATANGPKPLVPLPEDGRDRRKEKKARKARRCSVCGSTEHNRMRCRSPISSAALLLRAKGAAAAAREVRSKGE